MAQGTLVSWLLRRSFYVDCLASLLCLPPHGHSRRGSHAYGRCSALTSYRLRHRLRHRLTHQHTSGIAALAPHCQPHRKHRLCHRLRHCLGPRRSTGVSVCAARRAAGHPPFRAAARRRQCYNSPSPCPCTSPSPIKPVPGARTPHFEPGIRSSPSPKPEPGARRSH